jgi:hypothetical protein
MSCWQAFACAGAAVAGAAMAALSAWGVMQAETAALRFADLSAEAVAVVPGALYETSGDGGAPLCVIESARAEGAATAAALRAGGLAATAAGATRLDGAPAGARPDVVRTLRLDAALRLGPHCVAKVRESWARGAAVCLVESVMLDGATPLAVRFHPLALRPSAEGHAPLCPLHGAEAVPWPAALPAGGA